MKGRIYAPTWRVLPYVYFSSIGAMQGLLLMALCHARNGDIHSATGRPIRAASMLKQACAEIQIGGAA